MDTHVPLLDNQYSITSELFDKKEKILKVHFNHRFQSKMWLLFSISNLVDNNGYATLEETSVFKSLDQNWGPCLYFLAQWLHYSTTISSLLDSLYIREIKCEFLKVGNKNTKAVLLESSTYDMP